ncbi:uncharacterized protein E0L32_004992 [Thyridium curvatum]|uniref:Uncharacterized protein n=1 Tax=Thyridium curvatum TaxID=1093900 RepID=A0A507B4Y6_9PEZI|nr:uncharacterized protein E0L32_004992 [Thyridium curvatum]TPX14883.1 hypothetical protein E0L32_004992 [Thyridium curvatum]
MALQLYIPNCISKPAHHLHFPPLKKPLRIQIEGPTVAIERILPDTSWPTSTQVNVFPQPAGLQLANLAFHVIYGKQPEVDDLVIRDEYLGWIQQQPLCGIDYYGVTFDHHIPSGDLDPEVLQINIIEIENDTGWYAKEWLPFEVDPSAFIKQKVLAVPR